MTFIEKNISEAQSQSQAQVDIAVSTKKTR